MTHGRLLGGAALLAGLGLAVVATAQSNEGVKQTERLIRASGRTVKAIGDTKVQLLKTMDVYNALMADDARNRKRLYENLQKEMSNTGKRRAKISDEATKMRREADRLFEEWADSIGAIENPGLRTRSEERLEATRESYAEIEAVGQKAADLYSAFMKELQDQVTFLGHDLNPAAVASLEPEAAKLNERAETIIERIDDTIVIANQKIRALRPQ